MIATRLLSMLRLLSVTLFFAAATAQAGPMDDDRHNRGFNGYEQLSAQYQGHSYGGHSSYDLGPVVNRLLQGLFSGRWNLFGHSIDWRGVLGWLDRNWHWNWNWDADPDDDGNGNPGPTPRVSEPGALGLLALGLVGIGLAARRRVQRAAMS